MSGCWLDVWIEVGRWVVVGWMCRWMCVGERWLGGCVDGCVGR